MYDQSQNYEDEENESDTTSIFDEQSFIRVQTAPARPLSDLEEFKRSNEFMLLEQGIVLSQNLVQKNFQKYDLDSSEGQKFCKKYLQIIEKLCEVFSIKTACREYRSEFSKAYKILYKEGSLCYLTEILDSAQEGFPYLWVNGEKYVFSLEVLDAGQKLQESFFKMQHILKHCYGKVCQDNLSSTPDIIRQDISEILEEFDHSWAKFEQLYVLELMLIENDARRYISKAIEIEQEMTSIEIREKIKGKIIFINEEYTNLRRKLCKLISQINSVANLDGKGRDDLNFETLQEAEGILRRITKEQSKSVRVLGDKIIKSFTKLRQLFRKYEQNIEMVDPQLKNNQDLVEALIEYENSWEKGKNYFLDPKKCTYLIHFSHIIEITAEKYKEFQELIECRDADIFLNIPCLMILKLLENEDKNICQFFLPQLFENQNKLNLVFQQLKFDFLKQKDQYNTYYVYHNILEKQLIGIQLSNEEQNKINIQNQIKINQIIQQIKILSMELARNNPSEWNNFFDAALS